MTHTHVDMSNLNRAAYNRTINKRNQIRTTVNEPEQIIEETKKELTCNQMKELLIRELTRQSDIYGECYGCCAEFLIDILNKHETVKPLSLRDLSVEQLTYEVLNSGFFDQE